MIAKLIVHGHDREDARRRLLRALRSFHVAGPANNVDFLAKITGLDAFASVELDTSFIERHAEILTPEPSPPRLQDLAGAAIALQAQRALHQHAQLQSHGNDTCSPWIDVAGWRMNTPAVQHFAISCAGGDYRFTVCAQGQQLHLRAGDQTIVISGSLTGDQLTLEMDNRLLSGRFAVGAPEHSIFWDDGAFRFTETLREHQGDQAAAGDLNFAAPMHGTVVALLAAPGSTVAAGDPVIVMEAMKMEQTLRAPSAGRVIGFHCAPGDLVDRGFRLVDFAASDEPA